MSDDTSSLVGFYRQHGISPVRQDITNLDAHFTRRAGLYRHLGLLPGFFRDRSVIEIGPGSGFNSLFTATLGPSRYVLLEGNPKGVVDIETLFGKFEGLRDRIEIVSALIQDYDTTDRFDVVICEGMLALAGVPDPAVLLRGVARLTAPGGVLLITTIDALSDFAETLRRLLAHLLLDPAESLGQQAARLTPVFAPHLSTLSGMSRPHEDWVIDNLLNPASIGPYLSIPDAIAGLDPHFELFGTSPRFMVDWRWYKTIVPGKTRCNEIALEQYWQNAHNLLDYRTVFEARGEAENRMLYALCEGTRDLIRQFESTRDRSVVTAIRARLEEIDAAVAGFSPNMAAAVREVAVLAGRDRIDGGDVAASAHFGPWFGRGQQYLSFSDISRLMTSIPPWLRGRAFWDGAFAALIFVAGSQLGSRYLATFQQTTQPEFGQYEFGAAVSVACGDGFVEPTETPALRAFLSRKTDSFSCDQLLPPPEIKQTNFTQKLYQYLMTAVALQWKWSGIAWSKLTPLFGVVFGLTLASAYGLFRLAAPPLPALVGVFPLAVSAHQLFILPQLRDYAKAPFMLLLLLIMALLARSPLTPRRGLFLGGAFGLVMGIGFGFRNDLLINLPPFVAVVFLLTPGRWRDHLRVKAACVALAAALFLVTAWPILKAYGSGSNTGHVAVLGYMTPFDGPLGLTRPAYDLGRHYVDGFAGTVVFNHGIITTGHVPEYLSADYERVAMSLITALVRHWPADIFARGSAAALQVIELPFTVGWHSMPVPIGLSGTAATFYESQMTTLRWLSGLGLPLAVIAIIIIGAANLRGAVALILLVMFYCGYPAVQFQTRHLFHLEFIGWWSLLFVVSSTASGLWRVVRTRRVAVNRAALRGSIVTAAVMLAFTVVPLSALRWYQQRHVSALFDGYLQISRTALSLTPSTDGDRTLLRIDGLWADRQPATPAAPRYLVAEFSAGNCRADNLPVVFKYEVNPQASVNDFSFSERLEISAAGPTRQLVPAYLNGEWSRFVGLSLPAGYEGCLASVSRIDDLSAVPVLMNASLAPQWQSRDLFQRIETLETANLGPVLVKTTPPDLIAPDSSTVISTVVPTPDDLAPGVTVSDSGRMHGRVLATTPQLRLVHFPETPVEHGTVLRIRGVVHRGGLLFGLLKNEAWSATQAIDRPGPFMVLLSPPEAGRFGILIADHSMTRWRMEQQSLLRHAAMSWFPSAVTDEFELTDITWLR